jgi:predicted PurR-regulated permease PerM
VTDSRFRNAFLILLVIAISAAFFAMVRAFLLTIVLAALFTGVAYPAYRRLVRLCRGRQAPAAIATLVLLLVVVIVPLFIVAGAVVNEALQVSTTTLPRLRQLVDEPGETARRFERALRPLPGYALITPYRNQILTKAAELVGSTGAFVIAALSATTFATALFIFHFIVLLYTMFFFLTDGPRLLRTVLAYVPLADADKNQMLERFVSVTRATLKGTVLIGIIQGTLGGLAFWAVGIDGAIFWGTIMTVLSIIPGIGGALVWVPATVILLVTGQIWQGIALVLFCGLVVGSVDNLLRPMLVGRDTQMHELLIFFSTLGGLILFGAMGFVLGPVLAALFVTIWEMFGVAFRSELAEPAAD